MAAAGPAPSPSAHTQVLVIEDEPVIGALVKATLEDAGFTVTVLDALEAAVAGIVNRATDAAGIVQHFRTKDVLN